MIPVVARLPARLRRARPADRRDVHLARGPQLRRSSARARRHRPKVVPCMSDARQLVRARPATGSRRPSSTRSTCAGSTTATTTAPATSAGSPTSSTTCSGSASTASGCCRSTRARCATAATTSPTSSTIHPDYGNIDDFKYFVDQAHQRGMRVIADLVMNHTSSDHPWFQASRADPDGPVRRLVRVGRRRHALERGAHHLPRHRAVELDVGPGARAVLLAPLLLATSPT